MSGSAYKSGTATLDSDSARVGARVLAESTPSVTYGGMDGHGMGEGIPGGGRSKQNDKPCGMMGGPGLGLGGGRVGGTGR